MIIKSSPQLVSDTPYDGDRESTANPISASTSLPSYDIPTSPTKPVLANTKPLLVTPVIEPIEIPPTGSGATIIAEPELGTPIVRTPSPVGTGGTPYGLPPKVGGAGSGTGSDTGAMTNSKKKPNYVLYLGILLAVIVAYKLLSSKKEN
jgi:hypothetical protein